MNDVVYIIRDNTKEYSPLKYSLRSIERFLKDFRRVVIVGPAPEFMNPETYTHIPATDTSKLDRAKNIMGKIMAAANNEAVSDSFFFMNDDHFLLSEVSACNYPYYYSCQMEEKAKRRQGSMYTKHVWTTHDILKASGVENPIFFDIHCPMIFSKGGLNIMTDIHREAMSAVKYGCVAKSLYGNTFGVEARFMTDCKIDQANFKEQILQRIEKRHVFSVGGMVIRNRYMVEVLEERFPQKSIYEK